jgi:hypothetical protein
MFQLIQKAQKLTVLPDRRLSCIMTISQKRKASAVLQEMATGSLDVAVNGAYQGDHALLAQAVNHTIDSKEQVSGIIQVSQGVNKIAQVTQTNTTTAEQSAAASEELATQAELLQRRVSMGMISADDAVNPWPENGWGCFFTICPLQSV